MGITKEQLVDALIQTKDYVDNKSVSISPDANNAVTDSNGLFVKDLSTELDKIDNVNKNIYSTDEQVFGTWIDGKPIYRKTLQTAMPQVTTDGTSVSKAISISDLNIDDIIDISGVFTGNGYTGTVNCYINDTSYNAVYGVNANTSLAVYSNTKLCNTWTMYITIQYTKKAD